jgi:tRNA dimethylallyltransferase
LGLGDTLVLAGPTASGKTALALRIAHACQAEVIALDSMTLYRGMDIGTAKPGQAERRRIPHHLIDVLDPWEDASVAWWLERARAAAREIQERGHRVLFVGGTGLYLKALLCGLFEGPGANEEVRLRLESEAAEAAGTEKLVKRLHEVDPDSALRLHSNDLRRIIRALEVWETTGRSLSSWQTEWKDHSPQEPRPTVFWLDLPRRVLHQRINDRVPEMLKHGWLEEVRSLQNLGRPPGNTASQALGYRELLNHLNGQLTLEEAIQRIQAGTRQFAKRQVTWFRHLPGCQPIHDRIIWQKWNLDLEF